MTDKNASRASWRKWLDRLRTTQPGTAPALRIVMRWHAESYAEARGWVIEYTRAKVFRQ